MQNRFTKTLSAALVLLFVVIQSSFSQGIKASGDPGISGGAEAAFENEKAGKSALQQKSDSKQKVTHRDLGNGVTEIYLSNSTKTSRDAAAKPEPLLEDIYESLDFDGNAANTGFYQIPPDPIGAAGPDHLVAVVNSSLMVHTKGAAGFFSLALQTFFGSPTLTFDPKVIYDQHAGRFLIVTLEVEGRSTVSTADDFSRFYLAVSDDSDPFGLWYAQVINSKINISGVDRWADYPGFAIDEEAVYVTNNMFSWPGAYGGSRLWIFDKALYGGAIPSAVTVLNPYATPGSIATTTQPTHMFGTPPAALGTFLVSYSGLTDGLDEYVQILKLNDPLTAPAFTLEFINAGNLESFASFPDAPQLGTATLIETNDRRALHSVWRSDQLYMCAEINPIAGPDAGQITAHWWNLNNSGGSSTLTDQGNAGGEDIAPGCFTYFPCIAVNGTGDMAIGFSASAPTIYPGAYYNARFAADPAGTLGTSQVLRTGLDHYKRTFGGPRNRWGDYSGLSVDPSDDCTFWVFNEYAITRGTAFGGEDGRYGTAFGSFRLTPSVVSFTLIDTDTDAPVADFDPIPDGAIIDLFAIGNDKLNIRANTVPATTGSVAFDLWGSSIWSNVEDFVPYALFDDFPGGDYKPWKPKAPKDGDTYTLCAKAYTGAGATGIAGKTHKISFSFVSGAVTSFTLYDSQTNLPIGPLTNGDVVDLGIVGKKLNIVANTNASPIGSVRFRLNTNFNYRTENEVPFALAGDNPPGDFLNWTPALGFNTVRGTPYSGDNATGVIGVNKQIKFKVVNTAAKAADGVVVYPNRSEGPVTFLSDNEEMKQGKIQIYNSIGQLVYEKEFRGGLNESVNLKEHGRGMYVGKITSAAGSNATKTIVIE